MTEIIEVKVVNKKGDAQDYVINKDKVTYFRGYVETSSEVKAQPKLKTAVYLMGSTKALILDISYDEFKRKFNK
jgi:hypothetical protein|tara:strand:+ start:16752 stop:16973 length:222 start_codon:yes stop_codon:yes gene_type:complete